MCIYIRAVELLENFVKEWNARYDTLEETRQLSALETATDDCILSNTNNNET